MDFAGGASWLKDIKGKVASRLRSGLVLGMRSFEAFEIENEMSGRPGLNRRSGHLAGSWRVELRGSGADSSAVLHNRPDTWYAKVHQHLNFNVWIIPKTAKRLAWKETTFETRISKSGNKYTKYGAEWRFARKVYIPKRLNLFENFKRLGADMIRKKIAETVAAL